MPLDERWLSHLPCLERITQLYIPIISALSEMFDEYPLASGLLTQLCRVKISALIFHYVDLLRPLYNLSKIFQRRNLTFDELQISIDAVRSSLAAVCRGEFGSSATDYIGKLNKNDYTFDGKLNLDRSSAPDIDKELNDVYGIIRKAGEIILQNLEERFPRDHKLYNLLFLVPTNIRRVDTVELRTYGNQELMVLISEINDGIALYFRRNQELRYEVEGTDVMELSMLSTKDILNEWEMVKHLVKFEYASLTDDKIYPLLHRNPLLSSIAKVYAYMRCVPLTSVECERMFSRMNIIKTSLRNQLEEHTLDKLLRVSITDVDIKTFDFRKAFLNWKNAKTRLFAF
jgi:hypothetical protein